jgi:esterase/lipase superfamily enzyme
MFCRVRDLTQLSGPFTAIRVAALALTLFVLTACTPRGAPVIDATARGIGHIETVFVGTTRGQDSATGEDFGIARSFAERYARYDVSIPPNHETGKISWPKRHRPPDPAHDFLTADREVYADSKAFRDDLSKALRAAPKGQREAFVFVHGYNNTFAEGVYRLAQLGQDLGTQGVLVSYSWPSRASVLGYVYDRDSVLFARDGLEQLLREVNAAGAERIFIVGHSLGAHLTMETIRQMALSGDKSILSRISGVALMSPDIDVDVFQSQARSIGKLPQPFFIFTSQRDRALSLSARLTGEGDRLGNVKDAAQVGNLQVTLIDTSAFDVGSGHFNVGNSPALIALLGRLSEVDSALAGDERRPSGLLPGVVLTIRNATEIILSPVTQIANARRGLP